MLILSELTLYYFNVIHSLKSASRASRTVSLSEGPVKDWAKKVVSKSQLNPSAPPSTRSVKGNDDAEIFVDDAPEEFDHRGVVHIIQTNDNVQRGRKRTLSVAEDSDLGDLTPEEQQEVQEDPDADLSEDAGSDYKPDEDVDWAHVGDIDGTVDADIIDVDVMAVDQPAISQQDNSMSVGVTDDRSTKYIKTKDERVPVPVSQAKSLNLNKKGRAKNSQLPNDVSHSWRSRYIPALIYWVGNSNWPWTIPDEDFSNALYEIHSALCTSNKLIEFDVDTPGFELASQRIHEWRASFGSIAVAVLMAIFASMGDDYKTQESHKEYAEYLLDGLRFVYEDPDDEEQPGAFLSEFILRIFATHLNAIHGHEKVDTLDALMLGHQTSLALTTAAAERALILARDGLILDCEPSDNMKKTHKIALTLNNATNRMSTTGTAFSASNWETDTMAYLNLIYDLPESRIKEIVVRTQPFMKRIRNKGHTSDTDGPTEVVNPRSLIRTCNIIFSVSQSLF
ncbi:hypothetical protein M405DRAFT_832305 [Rhizopogon salebrosus TDB-379]|nr:hypothetical protein M405DRAFT_832305 [Rhizopogon salebrosus TDB-379]